MQRVARVEIDGVDLRDQMMSVNGSMVRSQGCRGHHIWTFPKNHKNAFFVDRISALSAEFLILFDSSRAR